VVVPDILANEMNSTLIRDRIALYRVCDVYKRVLVLGIVRLLEIGQFH
jgi:hypothetical protein